MPVAGQDVLQGWDSTLPVCAAAVEAADAAGPRRSRGCCQGRRRAQACAGWRSPPWGWPGSCWPLAGGCSGDLTEPTFQLTRLYYFNIIIFMWECSFLTSETKRVSSFWYLKLFVFSNQNSLQNWYIFGVFVNFPARHLGTLKYNQTSFCIKSKQNNIINQGKRINIYDKKK